MMKNKSVVGASGPLKSLDPVRHINFIIGGSDIAGLTYSAAKRHTRESLPIMSVE